MERRQAKLQRFLFLSLALGLAFRLLAAVVVYGPQALDDYKHGVLPAYQLWAGLTTELPEYRSFLLPWLLEGFIRILAQPLGVMSALGQVRAMYVGLALFSLIGFVGPYFYARTFVSQKFGWILLGLLAVFPLMPFVSTRAFGEAVALPLVLSGLTLAEVGRKSRKKSGPSELWRSGLSVMLGLLLLGAATLFRFQVGLIFVTYGLILLLDHKKWFWIILGAGGITLLSQALIDLGSGREIFSTLWFYLKANEGGAAQYGVSPWYNTWFLVLGLGLFPFSFVLWPESKWVVRRHWRLMVPFFVFVLAHSLTPHKEERFMYPIVGLILLFLAEALARGWRRMAVRRVFVPLLALLQSVGLVITCLNNTQVGEIEPMAEINRQYPLGAGLIDRHSLLGLSRIQDYFVRSPSEIIKKDQPLQIQDMDRELLDHPEWQAAAVLTSDPSLREELIKLVGFKTDLAQCGEMQTAHSWVDALLYKMNPKHNQRRRPTWYVICARDGVS